MSAKVETIQSTSSGIIGRAVSHVRGQQLTLDSSTAPRPDAFTNSEAFLAAVSSCGVTLVEGHAKDTGVPLQRMAVTIEGTRNPGEARFVSVAMRFELHGVSQDQADALVEIYRQR